MKRAWFGGATILLADDDVAYASSVSDLLRLDGHAVHHVTDGQEAIDMARHLGERLDLLLCDLLLPRRTGFEVIKEVNASGLATPVLALTGVYRRFREIHALRGLGVRGYVHKSSPLEHLLFRVNALLHEGRENDRAFPRVTASLPVRFRSGERLIHAVTHNVSVTGLYACTPEPPAEGDELQLSFGLPTARQMLEAVVEVVHAATPEAVHGTAYPAGFGARFLRLSPLARTALAHYVEAVRAEQALEEPVADGPERSVTEVEPEPEPAPCAG